MNYKDAINRSLDAHRQVWDLVRNDAQLLKAVDQVIDTIIGAFRNGNKVLLCGNGGSAADAQHIAAEWQGRYLIDRAPLYAEALHVNTSYLTAVANDYHYDKVYARAVEAQGRSGDILIGLSTSGKSPNVVRAIEVANKKDMVTIGFTGAATDTPMAAKCNILLPIPSTVTARIQEMHILLAHIICEETEKALFGQGD